MKLTRTLLLLLLSCSFSAGACISGKSSSAESGVCVEEAQDTTQISASDDLWDRIRAGFQLTELDNTKVDVYVKSYQRLPGYLPRVTTRARPFLYHIVEELEKRDMPLEIALLPIVESAFDPFAYSHGSAAGMWQFIPGTGLQYGLKQNWWYDGRRDAIAATEAALDFLTDLHDRLDNDWLLALAAYNSGEGNVRKARRANKRRGKPLDFWSLNLPRETRNYVPQLLALSRMVREPEKYDAKLTPIPNTPYFDIVDTLSQIDLAQAANMADIPIKELYQLNAGYNRWATDPTGPHRLVIPKEHANTFRERLAMLGDDRVIWESYKVKSGDSLIKIANKFGTTAEALRHNNAIRGNIIRPGQILLIAKASQPADFYVNSQDQRLARKQALGASDSNQRIEYSVKSGDSFWSIAKQYNVKVSELTRWNGMAPKDTLRPRQKLVIWTSPEGGPNRAANGKPVIRKVAYKVRNGDSLARIAGRFNLSVNDIVRWNPIEKSEYIHPGQRLTLYVDVTQVSSL